MDTDFEELSHDVNLITKIKQFNEAVLKMQSTIDLLNDPAVYEKLSNSNKIKYNLLMPYVFNSMFWMYLRAQGVDPTKHQIKSENDRLKKAMLRAKQINDRNTLMPRLNKNAAQRFVRNSLWEAKDTKEASKSKRFKSDVTSEDDKTVSS